MFRRAYTLIEILVVVAVLGIASALVIPAMGSTDVLRVQGAVRTLVSDITFAQSDAAAFQERRAILFDKDTSTYRVLAALGDTLDPDNDTMFDPTRPDGKYIVDLKDPRFGNARIESVDFGDGADFLVFDALGGPVADLSSGDPGPGGTVRITGSRQVFDVGVEAFTGRVTVTNATPEAPAAEGGE